MVAALPVVAVNLLVYALAVANPMVFLVVVISDLTVDPPLDLFWKVTQKVSSELEMLPEKMLDTLSELEKSSKKYFFSLFLLFLIDVLVVCCVDIVISLGQKQQLLDW